MGLTGADLARLGPAAQKQILDKLGRQAREKGNGAPGGPNGPLGRGRARERAEFSALAGSEDERTLRGRKYHNEPDTRGKIKFHSRKEARRYDELMALLKAGKIRDLKLQKQFTLQESYVTPEGERVRAIRYAADFAYERATAPDSTGVVHWVPVVEDVKSRPTKTALYETKKKLLRERFNISITEV